MNAAQLASSLGVTIDPELLVLAMTHRSFAHEAGGLPTNERLEFLGDSVLGVIVTEALYRGYPDLAEGELAKMRAATVSQRALARVARRLDLGQYVLLGKGETATGGADKDSILSDTLEALFGAVYLCQGLEPTRAVIERLILPMLTEAANKGAGLDWKTSLQELTARLGLGAVRYQSTAEGPDHARVFTAEVVVGDTVYGSGVGSAKKYAEQIAAETAYLALTAAEQVQVTVAALGGAAAPGDAAPHGAASGDTAAGDAAAGAAADAEPHDPPTADDAGPAAGRVGA